MSSTSSSREKSFDLKDRWRKSKLEVKELFTRAKSGPPSRAPTAVPDHSSVGPTQGGNDEGVSWICCSNNPLIVGLGAPPIEHIQTPPEWDGWQVDQSSVTDLKTWFDQHGDTKWAKFTGEVNSALQSKVVAMLRDHIPDGILPIKSLANGIISLVQLVVVRYFHLSF